MYILRGVKTVDGGPVDLTIEGETIASLAPAPPAVAAGPIPAGAVVIPGDGLLVLPAFVDIHIHLDKAFVRDELPDTDGTLEGAIRAMRDRKARYTSDDVAARASRLIRSSVTAGATRIRTHVDIDAAARLVALEGTRRAAAECADLCDVQIVAFPQEGVVRDPQARRLMERAVELGVDAVGGMPHWEADPAAQREHVRFCFDLAAAADLDVDMHVDETDDAGVRTLEMVVDEAIARGWEGRVTVGHVCSLAGADEAYAARVIRKCWEASVNVIANPATNLILQGRGDRGLIRRGLTRVAEFRAAGVNLCFGQDNVSDGFCPFGRGDMLEIAFLAAHAAHLTSRRDLDYALRGVTEAPARVWGLRDYGVRPGVRADLMCFRAASWEEALRLQNPPELVFFKGRPVARSAVTTVVGTAPVLAGLRGDGGEERRGSEGGAADDGWTDAPSRRST
ncbi:MAG: amidohydrolase family protein [Armatimonadetes bacterium]|nr:amidohydrolase family protein [Armatimonadota bacterium]